MIGVILMAWVVVLLCVLLLALAFWAIVASDGESGMKPEEPTMNTRGKD